MTGRRRIVLAVALASLMLTGCTRLAERRAVRMFCEAPRDTVESALVLMAQAVPSARYVPCVNAFPAGWSLGTFEARSGRAVITFDSDRAGVDALRVTFEATCRPEGGTLPTDEAGAPDLRQRTLGLKPKYKAVRYYTFEGGCMLYTFTFPHGSESTLTRDAVSMVRLMERSAIQAQVAKFGFSL
jgi:hypothetical protein